jgi:hypothetical protein
MIRILFAPEENKTPISEVRELKVCQKEYVDAIDISEISQIPLMF